MAIIDEWKKLTSHAIGEYEKYLTTDFKARTEPSNRGLKDTAQEQLKAWKEAEEKAYNYLKEAIKKPN